MDAGGSLGGSATGWVGWPGSQVSLRVDRDTVMRAIRIVLDEAERYREKLKGYQAGMIVSAPGGDPVSYVAQRGLNERLWLGVDSYLSRCRQYARTLDALAEQLAEVARTYGHTEEEVAALFPARTGDRIDGDHYVV